MRRDDDAYLLDMLLAAREAAACIDADTKAAHPEIPWTGIVGMRNRLVPGYFNINLARVWDTVERDIPRLIPQLERLVPREEE